MTLPAGKEAYIEWTTSTGPGGDENLIYYRTSGTTGWTTAWDLCTGTTCTSGSTYESFSYLLPDGSSASILFQTPGVYEFLVWDENGDGTGAGSGGRIVIDDIGSNGIVPQSDSGKRMVSLVSTEALNVVYFWANTPNPNPVNLCSSVASCNDATSSISLITDAVNNGGYFELSFASPQSPNYDSSWPSDTFGRDRIKDVVLVVELEDNTPDSAPPTLENAQYSGDTFIEGEKTLYLALKDLENPIDTTTTNGPTLHYSVDSGNTYTTANAASINSCIGSNTVCYFEATTAAISAGTTVDYYWTYSDAAAVDNNKVPPQSPNSGRTPAAGDISFSVLDINQEPTDGSSMKLITKVDNVEASYDSGTRSTAEAYVDRQMTYYTATGEFLFEFGLSGCGIDGPYIGALSVWEQCFSTQDLPRLSEYRAECRQITRFTDRLVRADLVNWGALAEFGCRNFIWE